MNLKDDFGWSPTEESHVAVPPSLDKLTQLIINTFMDRPDLLIFLRDNYLQEPVAPVGCDPTWPYFREGQNQLVRLFIKTIEEASNGIRIDKLSASERARTDTR